MADEGYFWVDCGSPVLDRARQDYQQDDGYSFEECLISEVFERRELWDSKSVTNRGPLEQSKAWKEVACSLGIKPEEAKKRWKSLRDGFTRRLAAQKRYERSSNDAEVAPAVEEWRFFRSLQFLQPVLGYRKNVKKRSLSTGSDTTNSSELPSLRPPTPPQELEASVTETSSKTSRAKQTRNSNDDPVVSSILQSIAMMDEQIEEQSSNQTPKEIEVHKFCSFLEVKLLSLDTPRLRRLIRTLTGELFQAEEEQEQEGAQDI